MTQEMSKKEDKQQNVQQVEPTRKGRTFLPDADIMEKGDEILVLADVPGTKSEDIDINYENGVLDISARVAPRQDPGKANYLLREYSVGDFNRSFRIGRHIDVDKIKAELNNGVLTLHLPKAEQAKRKQIEVNQS